MADYNTKHREEILTLFEHHHLLTAGEIKEKLPDIDTVTIYRTLKRLKDSEVVKEVKHSTRQASYELNTDHQHFVCSKCQDVFPVEVDLKKLASAIQTNAGDIKDVHLDLTGVCTSCKKNGVQ